MRATLIGVLACVACAGAHESAVRREFGAVRPRPFAPFEVRTSSTATPVVVEALQSGLTGYVATALERHPQIRAAFERWRASVYRISEARRWPEPTISFRYFVRSVETRVGPQQARFGVQQAFPWPTKLTAGADAASANGPRHAASI